MIKKIEEVAAEGEFARADEKRRSGPMHGIVVRDGGWKEGDKYEYPAGTEVTFRDYGHEDLVENGESYLLVLTANILGTWTETPDTKPE